VPSYSFFHDDLVLKTNAELLNSWFKELKQATALFKQEHASVFESRVSLWDSLRIFYVWCSTHWSDALAGVSKIRVLWPPGTEVYSTHAYKHAGNLFSYTYMYLLVQLQ